MEKGDGPEVLGAGAGGSFEGPGGEGAYMISLYLQRKKGHWARARPHGVCWAWLENWGLSLLTK